MSTLIVDEVMLREPSLMIPRAVPIGPIRADLSHPLLRGCIGYWPLIDRKGETAWDLVGTNHGTLGNGCIFGNESAIFPSANDDSFIDLGLQSWAPTSGSIVIWAKSYQETDDNSVVLINRNESGTNDGDMALQWTNAATDYMEFFIQEAGQSNASVTGSATMPLSWTQYVCLWTTTKVYLTENGIYQIDNGIGRTLKANATQPFLIGSFKKTAPFSWYGEVRNVMFYERFLSTTEIMELYLNPFQVVRPA